MKIHFRANLTVAQVVFALLFSMWFSACNEGRVSSPVVTFPATPSAPPTLSPAPVLPSPTPVPIVARVNGEEITLSAFEAELARYRAAAAQATSAPVGTPDASPTGAPIGTQVATSEQQVVLDELINQTLLAQAAAKEGFSVDEATLQQHYEQLLLGLGGEQALQDWMASNSYTPESFRQDLKRSIAAAWMRDKIVAAVPQEVEQVHARQIVRYGLAQAQEVLAKLQAGADFAELAAQYDPIARGDLGWFPRGYLSDPDLEKAAFSLQPGEYSPVIATSTGFHILQVIEREPQHPLTPDARLVLQLQALQGWLEEQRNQSQIQILLP